MYQQEVLIAAVRGKSIGIQPGGISTLGTADYEAMRANFGKELYREHTVAEGCDDCDCWIKNR